MNKEVIIYILDYLDANLYNDISIDDLSMYFGYEKSYLMKKFKLELGMTIKEYVNKRKIYNSLGYLHSDDLLLKIALDFGFNSLEYYSELFTKVVGVPPSIFRKYPNGILTKSELEAILAALEDIKLFNKHIMMYRNLDTKGKVLRLEIPKEKKYAA